MSRCAIALAAVLVVTPSLARASDGYEVALPASAALIGTIALDVTFIVATSVGLTDRDDGWAALQLAYGLGSMGASAVLAGILLDEGNGWEGAAGALILQGIGSLVLSIYGIVGLESLPNVEIALAPTNGGLWASSSIAF